MGLHQLVFKTNLALIKIRQSQYILFFPIVTMFNKVFLRKSRILIQLKRVLSQQTNLNSDQQTDYFRALMDLVMISTNREYCNRRARQLPHHWLENMQQVHPLVLDIYGR